MQNERSDATNTLIKLANDGVALISCTPFHTILIFVYSITQYNYDDPSSNISYLDIKRKRLIVFIKTSQ